MREYHGSLLDTVYWALGGLFATAILLAGFGWWSNFKLYEHDKTRLREELQVLLKQLESTLALRIEQNRAEAERAIDAKVEVHVNRLLTEAADLRSLVNTERTERHAQLDKLSSRIDALTTQINKADRSLAIAEAELREVEQHVWRLKDIPGNIVISQAQGVLAAVQAKNKGQTSRLLDGIKNTLQEDVVEKNRFVSKAALEIVTQMLDSLPKEYTQIASDIRDILKQVAGAPDPSQT